MSICPVIGMACDCQPDNGIPCTNTLENVVKGFHGWRNDSLAKGARIATLEEALRRIMRGVDCSEQSYQYAEEALGTSAPDGNYTDSIDVPPPCDTAETEVKHGD